MQYTRRTRRCLAAGATLLLLLAGLQTGVGNADAVRRPASAVAAVPKAKKAGWGRLTPTSTRLPADYRPPGSPAPRDVTLPDAPRGRVPARAKSSEIALTPAQSAATPRPQAPATSVTRNFAGVAQAVACNCAPPDPAGAVGATQFLQVTNSHYDVWNKVSPNSNIQSVTLNSKLGEPSDFLFDPRALYDPAYRRFVTIATRAATSSTEANSVKLRIAVSPGSDATSPTYNSVISLGGGPFTAGRWIDYPMIGMDQDSILFSGNLYQTNSNGTSSFVTTFAFAIAKARLYNNLGFTFPAFSNLPFRIAPPVLQDLDQNDASFWAGTSSGAANTISLWRMTNSAHPASTTFTFRANVAHPVALGTTQPPPLANQPGAFDLSTVNRAMQSPGSQYGNSLWIVHTDGGSAGTYAFPRYFQINTTTNAVTRYGTFFASGSSSDWSASVAVGGAGDNVFFNWSSTSPTVNPQMRVAVCRVSAGTCGTNLGAGTLLVTSASVQTQIDSAGRYRWGDYSATSIDPANSCTAWATNQKAIAASSWGTQIASFKAC